MVKSDHLAPDYLLGEDVARLTGCEQEHKVFEKLKYALLKKKDKNTVVISSWSDKGAKGRKNREIDFIILSLPLTSIFQIEVKKSSNKTNLNNGINQLEEGKKFFSSTIPFPPNEQWKMVRVLSFGKLLEPLKACISCGNFLLGNEPNLADWWDSIAPDQPTEPHQESGKNAYLAVLKYLLFQLFLQEDQITKGLNKFNYQQNIKSSSQLEYMQPVGPI